jgi:hypothetical protein
MLGCGLMLDSSASRSFRNMLRFTFSTAAKPAQRWISQWWIAVTSLLLPSYFYGCCDEFCFCLMNTIHIFFVDSVRLVEGGQSSKLQGNCQWESLYLLVVIGIILPWKQLGFAQAVEDIMEAASYIYLIQGLVSVPSSNYNCRSRTAIFESV